MKALPAEALDDLREAPFTYPEVGATRTGPPEGYRTVRMSRRLAGHDFASAVEEPNRAGFAYGTLPGHPESGEELFLVERAEDGTVVFTVEAFSKPASLLARAAGPLSRRVQDAMTARYARAIAAG